MGKINKFFKKKDKKNSKDNIVPNQPVPGQNRSFNDITDQFKAPEMEQQFNKKNKKKDKQKPGTGPSLKGLDKQSRVSTLNYYTERLLNKMTKGSLDIQGSSFEISYSKIMSETHKKRVIYIKEYPMYIYAGHLEKIRLDAKRKMPESDIRKCDVNIIEHTMMHHINFANNKKLKSSERNFRRQLIDINTQRTKTISAMRTGVTALGTSRDDIQILNKRQKRLERKIYSYTDINFHQSRGGETLKTYCFIEIVGETTAITDELADNVIQLLSVSGYKYEEITELDEYLSTFGLASVNFQKKMKWDIHPLTVTSDVSAVTPTYSEGIIRSAAGDVYIGNSLETGYPVFISFSESAAAQNVLVVADSGSGKTVLVKTIVLGSLNHRQNTYNVVVTDYKGGEWSYMAKSMDKAEEVSMGMANPKFVNTLAIPDYETYGFEDPTSSYYLALGYTVKLLATLSGTEDKTKLSQVQNVCNDIVERVYLYNQIDVKRPSTYHISSEIPFRESLWEAIEYICTKSDDMEKRHGKELLSLVKTSLEYYFTAEGSKSYMFENSLSIDELMKKKLIIFDYGAQTAGGQGTLLEKEVHAKILQKNFFTILYSAKNKLSGQYTIEIEEEVQRQLNSPMLSQELNDKITGGRSSNRSTILLTNTVLGLLSNTTDTNITAIKENINTVMLGRCKKEVAGSVMQYFDLMQAQSRVMSILTGNGQYSNSFLMAFNTGKVFDMCVAKVTLPKSIIDSPMFESRKVEEYDAKDL